MGQGGYLVICNATPYNWHRSYQHSYQMKSWDFPLDIHPWTSITLYVEFDEGAKERPGDDGGDAYYQLLNDNAQTEFHFAVKFRDLLARFPAFPVEMPGEHVPRGGEVSLGWRHDNSVVFVLAGEIGNLRLIKY
ncbi:hypothetical protein GY45DRAFT_201506 [Cubamyces sp. BRFM 1775]|nr:hypothetical protein GY45DRAFT_201506 [Cubamyces sp. BRFM 1775]